MNPLDDHELLLWAMRAGLTHDEVRQAVRQGLDSGASPGQPLIKPTGNAWSASRRC